MIEHDPETGEVIESEAIVPASQNWLDVGRGDPVGALVMQRNMLGRVMKEVMREGVHYGTIPGTPKPSLWKPGAELLDVLFRLAPRYVTVTERVDGEHLYLRVRCILTHIPTGQVWGEGIGSCSTMESKYRYRGNSRKCPSCGKETIIKGKAEYGGGWVCFAKKGGCGSKWKDGDQAIESQSEAKIENPDLADTYNTVDKMACKRALVAAVLNSTAASETFTQDMEDFVPYEPPSPVVIPQGQSGRERAAGGAKDGPRPTPEPQKPAKPSEPILDALGRPPGHTYFECPSCHKEAVRINPQEGAEPHAYCWKKANGCGATYTAHLWNVVSVPDPGLEAELARNATKKPFPDKKEADSMIEGEEPPPIDPNDLPF